MNRNVLPERMKEIRESIGLKQGEMAEKMGIARTSLCLYENGQRTPDAHVLKQFILASGASPYYLLGLHDTKKDEYASVFQELGLSEKAIDNLRENRAYSIILSLMLESDRFWWIIRTINRMIEYTDPKYEYSFKGATIEDNMFIDYDDAHRYSCQRRLDEIIDSILVDPRRDYVREYADESKEAE